MSVVSAIVIEGDSLTASLANGLSGTFNRAAYPWAAAGYNETQVPGASTFGSTSCRVWPFPLAGMIAINRAVNGSTLTTMSARAAADVDAVINSGYPGAKTATGLPNNRAARKYALSAMIGTNQVTSDFTAAATSLKTYLQARVAAGYTGIIVCTILSRGDGTYANFETYRQGYNAILRSAAWLNGLGARMAVCADFGAEPTIGAATACDDATLIGDTVHPTALGYTYMTPLWLAAVNAVKAAI